MTQKSICLATQVLEILIDDGNELQIDETTYLIGGRAYERFQVGDILYLDVETYLEQIEIEILNIQVQGRATQVIDRGVTGVITISLAHEAVAHGVMNHPKHLYRLEFVSSVPSLGRGQITFTPARLS